MKKLFSVVLLLSLPIIAAEDVTETTPQRLGFAVGLSSAPMSVGFRIPIADHYSVDLALHIPEYISTKTDAAEMSGMELGGLVGYSFPLRLEENIAFVLRPQLDVSLLTMSGKSSPAPDSNEIEQTNLDIMPGVFAGVEVFMEEVGIPNMNLLLGFTAGMVFESSTYSYYSQGKMNDVKSHSFRGPLLGEAPFGATVSIFWYF